MDGFEAAKLIRGFEKAKGSARVPIIAMTAHALKGDREKCIAAGMDEFLTKPLDLEQLPAVLKRASGEYVSASAPASAPAPADPAATAARLDPTMLESLRGLRFPGEPDPLVEILDVFLRDTPLRMREAEVAASRDDVEGLRIAAHTLKGSANNLGARRLGFLAGHMENAAKCPNWDTIRRLLPEVSTELDALNALLEEERLR
jgi:CheY-like chemotaxis protein